MKQQFISAKTFRGCPGLMWKYQFYGSAQEIYGSVLNSKRLKKNPGVAHHLDGATVLEKLFY